MIIQDKFDEHFPDLQTREGHIVLTDYTTESFKELYEIVKPKKMLEIGFNAGHSTFGFLELFPDLEVHSIDISRHKYTRDCAKKIESLFPDRFKFGTVNSHDLTPDNLLGEGYDLVFIDGDHSREGICNDYDLCLRSDIEWILIDDYNIFRTIKALVNHVDSSENHPYKIFGELIKYDNDLYNTDPEHQNSVTHGVLLKRIRKEL